MSEISKIDKNFDIQTKLDKSDIKYYDLKCGNFEIYGLYKPYEVDGYCRMDRNVASAVSEGVASLNICTAGGRIRFKTNSKYVAIYRNLVFFKEGGGKLPHMPAVGSSGYDIYLVENGQQIFYRSFIPEYNFNETFEQVIDFEDDSEKDIIIHMPLYNGCSSMYIGLQENAYIKESSGYKKASPMLFYGSSITQGGCASRPGNAYTAMVARWLDADHINLGFSGSGKSEPDMIDYIASLDMSFLVYDYDHNAGSVDYLKSSHERGFKQFREKQPDTPVIMLSMPNWEWKNQTYCFDGGTVPFGYAKYRRDVIYNTYSNAIKAGDERVMFVDGRSYFAGRNRYDCTVDGSHPNDLGMYKMAESVADAIELFLRKLK